MYNLGNSSKTNIDSVLLSILLVCRVINEEGIVLLVNLVDSDILDFYLQ